MIRNQNSGHPAMTHRLSPKVPSSDISLVWDGEGVFFFLLFYIAIQKQR